MPLYLVVKCWHIAISTLEIRTIECYARLEEELVNYTDKLLMIDELDYPVDDFYRSYYFENDPNNQLRYASKDSYVDWDEFKECITESYNSQLEDKKFDMNGVYSPWEENHYISVLGLDGITK